MVEVTERDPVTTGARPQADKVGLLPAVRRHSVLKVAPTSFFADYGCHVRILEETFALQDLGSRVVVCTYKSGRDIPGIDIRRALGLPFANGIRVGSSKRKVYFDAWLYLRAMAASLGFRPSVVHAHLHEGALIGYPISKLFHAPLIFDFQGSLTCEMVDHTFLRRDSMFYAPLRSLESVINRMATAIITSSRNAADVLIKEFGCDSKKVYPIPDCVNADRFRPRWEVSAARKREMKRRLGIPEDRKVVVYLGLLAEYQGSSYLLRAAQSLVGRLPNVHFLLMGYPGTDRYRDLATALGIQNHVTFTGRIFYETAPSYLSLGDAAITAKISETEGNGKLLNYMAVGLPTVSFDTPVSKEILGDVGVYAPLGSVEGLATALEYLLIDERGAEQRGRELRERVLKHYLWEQGARQILDIYDVAAAKG
ncbi:MAG: glycosyltransferase family 4 protein [Chloroflexi bacterium]|nr:glycosyltransferase family 4 protein [Chloroflexota bacterium]